MFHIKFQCSNRGGVKSTRAEGPRHCKVLKDVWILEFNDRVGILSLYLKVFKMEGSREFTLVYQQKVFYVIVLEITF